MEFMALTVKEKTLGNIHRERHSSNLCGFETKLWDCIITSPTRNTRRSGPTMYATPAVGRLTESALAPLVSRHYSIRRPGRTDGFTACGVSLVLTAVRRVDRPLGLSVETSRGVVQCNAARVRWG